jgi:hypothetical protein
MHLPISCGVGLDSTSKSGDASKLLPTENGWRAGPLDSTSQWTSVSSARWNLTLAGPESPD